MPAAAGFYHVGRGSGANSLVAYCLRITDVDPIELDLYFERFLNPHRTSPPDFDIDFSHRDRDEVIDYVMKRYGKDHVALLGMYPTFQHNAIVRELGEGLRSSKSRDRSIGRNRSLSSRRSFRKKRGTISLPETISPAGTISPAKTRSIASSSQYGCSSCSRISPAISASIPGAY